jgi:hypothetical protein
MSLFSLWPGRWLTHVTMDIQQIINRNARIESKEWPVGCTIVMQKNAQWTSDVVGSTDHGKHACQFIPYAHAQ